MYSKPKGKELAALKRIRKLVEEIDAVQSDMHMAADRVLSDHYDGEYSVVISAWGITSGHALDGVRTNGYERLTSIANFVAGVRRIRRSRASVKRDLDKAIRKADRLLAALERIVAPFNLCKACKGRKGRRIVRREYVQTLGKWPRGNIPQSMSRWQDCAACDGRGIEARELLRG